MVDFKPVSDKGEDGCGFGSFPVTVVPHYQLKLSDGVHLAAKLWLPFTDIEDTCFKDIKTFSVYTPSASACTERDASPQPAILEYLPYRKSDWTLGRDWRHTWFSSHGYVSVRVDLRGSGDSGGFYYDEYAAQEQKDCHEVIEWLAGQDWCCGSVGMYGKSWGGFNGLQMAYEQPAALKTAISIYSTDDRYATDVHYQGGCIIGTEMMSWAAQMFAWNARPPNPHFSPNWRSMWKGRLEKASACWVETWLSHQVRDSYWKHGSICEDPGRINIPILAIGGWRDGYRDAVFRMATSLPRMHGIIGPWSHDWPDVAIPGPWIDFLNTCLEWWDCYLKGKETRAGTGPLLRLYIQEGIPPGVYPATRSGFWVEETAWPPSDPSRYITLIPDSNSMNMSPEDNASNFLLFSNESHKHPNTIDLAFCAESGLWSGEWLSYGCQDIAGDQRPENSLATCWSTEPLREPMGILGNAQLECTLISQGTTGMLIARLCDTFPDGRCSLITHGVLNLAHRNGHSEEQVKPLNPGEEFKVLIEMGATSYVIEKGHRLILALSPSYWPLVWPPVSTTSISIRTGFIKDMWLSKLTVPIIATQKLANAQTELVSPPLPAPGGHVVTENDFHKRSVEWDISGPERLVYIVDNKGCTYIQEVSTTLAESWSKKHYITSGDPLSAKVCIDSEIKCNFKETPEGVVRTEVITHSEMTCDDTMFHTKNDLKIMLNGNDFFQKSWNKDYERNLV